MFRKILITVLASNWVFLSCAYAGSFNPARLLQRHAGSWLVVLFVSGNAYHRSYHTPETLEALLARHPDLKNVVIPPVSLSGVSATTTSTEITYAGPAMAKCLKSIPYPRHQATLEEWHQVLKNSSNKRSKYAAVLAMLEKSCPGV